MTLATLDAPAAAEDAPPPTFDEALRWFRARVPMTQAAFDALAADAAGRAFTLAGVARLTVVSEVWRALDAALASGTTLRDFKREVAPSLLEQWGGSVANPAWRMELVFRNATQRAYVHGRVEQLRDPEVARIRPVWMFDAVGDARTSAICSALDGTVLAASDPWWSTHTPPCHHACRSTVRGLRASDPRAKAATSAPPMVAAQQGFGATPEAEGWRPRAADYPPEVWAAYQSGPSRAAQAKLRAGGSTGNTARNSSRSAYICIWAKNSRSENVYKSPYCSHHKECDDTKHHHVSSCFSLFFVTSCSYKLENSD